MSLQTDGTLPSAGQARFLVWLFLVSACFWWYFEYLNRFVQNWYYVDVDNLSRLQYFRSGWNARLLRRS